MKPTTALLALSGALPFALANTPIDDSLFSSNPSAAAKLAAPLWHFDVKTCFPTAAVQGDGSQTQSLKADDCAIAGHLNAGCPAQAKQTRQEQPSTAFPTYYTVRKCGDGSWRVVYDVYFQKDTGHANDWEWAAVKFTPNAQGKFVRAGIWLEQDGNHPFTAWGDIPHTFDGDSDKYQYNNKNRDHPKAFFGKWKHNVALVFNDKYANDCPGAIISKSDYHSDDYAFFAADSLLPDSAVPANYDYGKADSTPHAFEAGGKYDVCNLTS